MDVLILVNNWKPALDHSSHPTPNSDNISTHESSINSTHNLSSSSAHTTTSPSAHNSDCTSAHTTTSPSAHNSDCTSAHTTTSPSAHNSDCTSAHTTTSPSAHNSDCTSAHTTTSPSAHNSDCTSAHTTTSPSAHTTTSPSAHNLDCTSAHTTTSPSAHNLDCTSAHTTTSPSAHNLDCNSAHTTTSPSAHITTSPSAQSTTSPSAHTSLSAQNTTSLSAQNTTSLSAQNKISPSAYSSASTLAFDTSSSACNSSIISDPIPSVNFFKTDPSARTSYAKATHMSHILCELKTKITDSVRTNYPALKIGLIVLGDGSVVPMTNDAEQIFEKITSIQFSLTRQSNKPLEEALHNVSWTPGSLHLLVILGNSFHQNIEPTELDDGIFLLKKDKYWKLFLLDSSPKTKKLESPLSEVANSATSSSDTALVTDTQTPDLVCSSPAPITITSWNVNGITGKIRKKSEFVSYCQNSDIIAFSEVKACKAALLKKTFNEYVCYISKRQECAKRSGGVAVLIHNKLKQFVTRLRTEKIRECICLLVHRECFSTEKNVVLCFPYIAHQASVVHDNKSKTGIHKFTQFYKHLIQELGQVELLVMGDFNARTGIRSDNRSSHHLSARMSRDRGTRNPYGKQLIEFCNEHKVVIANGRAPGDETGMITCTANGARTVVDYTLLSSEMYKRMSRFFIDNNRGESDHYPLCACFQKDISRVPNSKNLDEIEVEVENEIKRLEETKNRSVLNMISSQDTCSLSPTMDNQPEWLEETRKRKEIAGQLEEALFIRSLCKKRKKQKQASTKGNNDTIIRQESHSSSSANLGRNESAFSKLGKINSAN